MKPIWGHALRFEGRCPSPHDRSRLWNGTGHGRCECGGRSPELPSTAARKRWHREHKAQVLATVAAIRERADDRPPGML